MTTAGESNVPYPPRFWWLKRLSLAAAVLLGCLLGLRLWWGHHAGRALAAEHARLRAAGEPVLPEDLDAPPVPPHRNAVAFIQRAAAVRNRRAESPSSAVLEYRAYPPYPPEWHKLADAAVAANGPVFPLLRQARTCDEADWGIQFRSPMFTIPLPMLNDSSQLANLASDAALREHVHGNDAAALELARDVRHISGVVARQPFLVAHNLAFGLDRRALHRLNVMAPALEVVPGEDIPVGAPVPDGPATRGQVQALIAELLREPAHAAGLLTAIRGERVLIPDTVRWVTRGNWVLRPMSQFDERRVIVAQDRSMAAATQPTMPAALALLPPPASADESRLATVISRKLTGSFYYIMRYHLWTVAERRFAAVALAVRLYRVDHDGAWPASLDALVPAYLRAVPADPLAPSGEPLGYLLVRGALPLGGDRPIVYSVGDNGINEVANGTMPLPPTPQYGWERGPDENRDLSRWLPLPTLAEVKSVFFGVDDADEDASPEAVEDQPDEADRPGQDD